ncbi:Maf family nucleotide pyrophosphatase [Penaeicola halotolerans]|uniref:Maf family nucleotide pyrophosphatase n=1 Tax=Penaeicola halotolerans TaxID=2793196 RepID=UPI001CF86337|nr:Maf family nucleotide pyrophosphatase [Penaeicola halotolerans]
MHNLTPYKIILASQSPRRKELLSGLGIAYESRVKQVDETYPETLHANEVANYLAQKKASAYLKNLTQNELVLTSDTVVILGDTLLGKPKDLQEAKEMLQLLSGQKHAVTTAVCLQSIEKQVVFEDTAWVTFKTLTEDEIDYYLSHQPPLDKAGAYGIQDWLGYIAITKLEGSFYTVMGLPVHLVYQHLSDF